VKPGRLELRIGEVVVESPAGVDRALLAAELERVVAEQGIPANLVALHGTDAITTDPPGPAATPTTIADAVYGALAQ
jgi:hypothetical protein